MRILLHKLLTRRRQYANILNNEVTVGYFDKTNSMPILGALMGFFLLSGTAVTPSALADVPVPLSPSYAVTLTAYNAVRSQTDDDPLVTASGAYSNPEVVAARSQDLADELPFGTIIEIDGPSSPGNSCGYNVVSPFVGYRVVADTMNARYSNYVDILFNTKTNYTQTDGSKKNASSVLGVCKGATVRVVGFVDISHPSHLPKTQAELIVLVTGDHSLAIK